MSTERYMSRRDGSVTRWLRNHLIDCSRAIGSVVCRIKGDCRYHYGPTGTAYYAPNIAHQCLRCGRTDRPLDTLYVPEGEDGDDMLADQEWERDQFSIEAIDAAYDLDRRWFRRLPYPRWA